MPKNSGKEYCEQNFRSYSSCRETTDTVAGAKFSGEFNANDETIMGRMLRKEIFILKNLYCVWLQRRRRGEREEQRERKYTTKNY